MSEQHTKEPCIAESVTDYFTEGTWLFEPVGNFRVGAGRTHLCQSVIISNSSGSVTPCSSSAKNWSKAQPTGRNTACRLGLLTG